MKLLAQLLAGAATFFALGAGLGAWGLIQAGEGSWDGVLHLTLAAIAAGVVSIALDNLARRRDARD